MKRLLDNTTIRTQIVIALLLVGLIPLVLVTLQALHCAHEGIVDVQRRQLTRLVHLQSSRIDGWIQERANLLRLVGSCAAMEELMMEDNSVDARRAMITYLEDMQSINPTIEAIAVFDHEWLLLAKGRSLTHAASDLLATDLQDRLVGAKDIVWSKDLHQHGDDYIAGHVGYPLRCRQGTTQGYLIASVKLNHAISGLHQLPSSDDGLTTYLIGAADQRYLSVPPAMQAVLGETASLPAAMQSATTDLVLYDDVQGKPVIGMARDLPDLPWKLVVELDRHQAFGLVHFLLRRASYMTVFIALVLLAVALPVARLLSRPLQELRDTCQRIAAGVSGQRVGHLKGREAQEVAASFNRMMDQLQETQRQLVQASTLAAVGELSASIVHEMRNPLNTIHLNLQAIRRKIASDPKYLELYELAERQTQRLQDMLNSLLSFGKPLELELGSVDLREIVTDVRLALRPQAERHGVVIREELPRQAVKAQVDREQFYRVLSNLVENAIQVQEGGGSVDIALREEGQHARVDVRDQGPGIPDGMREKIFRPFFTNRPAGTGLGLALAKKIVDLHDGRLAVSATSADGTTFTVHLPLPGGDPG